MPIKNSLTKNRLTPPTNFCAGACLMLCALTANTEAQSVTEAANQLPPRAVAAASKDASTTTTPGATLRQARTLFVAPSRRIDKDYVQYKLLKTPQLANWQITIVRDPRRADLILTLDQVRLNYLFTITDPQSSAVIVSGKVVAINDPVAADFLGIEIIKRMREVRGMD